MTTTRWRPLICFSTFALGLLAASPAWPATAGGADRGKVIYARRDGDGVLIHTSNSDLEISFPMPGIMRLRDPSPDAANDLPSPFVDTSQQTPYAKFNALDPRYQVLETDSLHVEMQADPLRLTVKDRAGNLIVGDDGGGISTCADGKCSWSAKFGSGGAIRGFGAVQDIHPGPGVAVNFDAPASGPVGLWVPPAPYGRLNDHCALLLRTAGVSQLRFPQAGSFQFSTNGPFEAYICLTDTDERYWETLSFLLGRPAFLPRWLLGTGYTLEHFGSLGEIRSLAGQLKDEGFPADWICFFASHPGLSGWNWPFAALGLEPTLWSRPQVTFDSLARDGSHAVFEVPSHFAGEVPSVSMGELLNKKSAASQPASSAPDDSLADSEPASSQSASSAPASSEPAAASAPAHVPTASFPLDYTDADQAKKLGRSLAALRDLGFTHWLMTEDERPPESALFDDQGYSEGAARESLRAEAWGQCLAQGEGAAKQRPFVLDREARADSNRRGHALAPWRIQPGLNSPSQAFRAAIAAANAGLPTWGLELPTSPSAYPSQDSLGRWLEAAVVAPYVLLRAPSWDQASPPQDVADIHYEFRRLFSVRARLRPWIYSLARISSINGLPVCRPGVPCSSDKVASLSIGNDALFVASDVDAPASISLDLPEGQWTDLNNDTIYQGGRKIDISLAPKVLPAFARAGALIPYWGDVENSDIFYFVARLYPSAKGQYALYEDAGDGNDYAKGQFAVTQFDWDFSAEENCFNLSIRGPLGDYAPSVSPRDMIVQIRSNNLPHAVFMGEKPVKRVHFVTSGSALLDPRDPLHFNSSTLPIGPAWDHDGQNFLYLWLPQREGNSKIQIYLAPGLASEGQMEF